MKILLIIVVTATIALIGSRYTFHRRRLPIGPRHIFLTGSEFIFIGLIFGPGFLNVIDVTSIKQLHPFLSFGLGWIGFMFGLQFDRRKIRYLPHHYFSITTIISLVTISIVAVVFWYVMVHYFQINAIIAIALSLSIAATASCTGQSSMAIVHRDLGVPSRGVMNLFRYIAAVDAMYSILIAGYALCYLKVGSESLTLSTHLQALKWFTFSLLIGTVLGYVFHFFSYDKLNQDELRLITIGVVMLASGIASFLELSALLIPFTMGYIVANRSLRNTRTLDIMVRSEKSVYILLVILAGAGWEFNIHIPFFLLVTYMAVRIAGKLSGGWLASRLARPDFPVPGRLGQGLLSQGGVAIAILINLQQVYEAAFIHTIFTVIVLSALFFELISPQLVIKTVRMKDV